VREFWQQIRLRLGSAMAKHASEAEIWPDKQACLRPSCSDVQAYTVILAVAFSRLDAPGGLLTKGVCWCAVKLCGDMITRENFVEV
jgi:hypothetical protein